MTPYQRTVNKRPFFSKRLLLFFIFMILIVLFIFICFNYLDQVKIAYQDHLIHDISEWQIHPRGQAFIDNQVKNWQDLKDPGIEILVIAYDYDQAGRIGHNQIQEATWYSWLPDQARSLQLKLAPELFKEGQDTSYDPAKLFERLSRMEESLGKKLDFLFILDLDDVVANSQVYSEKKLLVQTIDQAGDKLSISQALGHQLLTWHDFNQRAEVIQQYDFRVKHNFAYDHYLQALWKYNLRPWENTYQLNWTQGMSSEELEGLLTEFKSFY